MEETSLYPSQRAMFLLPLEILKERCLEDNILACKLNRLDKHPETLKDFGDLFFKEDGKIDANRFIWLGEDAGAFVSLIHGGLPRDFQECRFELKVKRDSRVLMLVIQSSTLEEAISCLDFIAGLQDDHYESMMLDFLIVPYVNGQPPICPFSNALLRKLILQNQSRLNTFCNLSFTPDQCGILATSGTRTKIGFYRCWFQDDGAAFVQSLWGLIELTIRHTLPFNERNFALFLNQQGLESLTLEEIGLGTEEACRALATADLQYLSLKGGRLADGGAALVESVREGRGPRGLRFIFPSEDGDDGDGERCISFLNALRFNSYVERLELSAIHVHDESPQALVTILRENQGLTHLSLEYCNLDARYWSELMEAISMHPSLRTLNFVRILDEDGL
jgi:hypothetical protein